MRLCNRQWKTERALQGGVSRGHGPTPWKHFSKMWQDLETQLWPQVITVLNFKYQSSGLSKQLILACQSSNGGESHSWERSVPLTPVGATCFSLNCISELIKLTLVHGLFILPDDMSEQWGATDRRIIQSALSISSHQLGALWRQSSINNHINLNGKNTVRGGCSAIHFIPSTKRLTEWLYDTFFLLLKI